MNEYIVTQMRFGIDMNYYDIQAESLEDAWFVLNKVRRLEDDEKERTIIEDYENLKYYLESLGYSISEQ